jgi:hypothetical protein
MPADTDSTPFDHLDPVPDHNGFLIPLHTAQIGQLALAIRDLTGVGGLLALSAAILIDQGKPSDGLATLADELDERRLAAEAKAEAAKHRSGR